MAWSLGELTIIRVYASGLLVTTRHFRRLLCILGYFAIKLFIIGNLSVFVTHWAA